MHPLLLDANGRSHLEDQGVSLMVFSCVHLSPTDPLLGVWWTVFGGPIGEIKIRMNRGESENRERETEGKLANKTRDILFNRHRTGAKLTSLKHTM